MSDGTNTDEIRSQLRSIETQLKSEGFGSIEETVSAVQKLRADLKVAEEARDKFFGENKEAAKLLGNKGGEIGFLKRENEKLKEEIESLKSGSTSATSKSHEQSPPKEEKPVEAQVAEVEAKLTDDQKVVLNKMIEAEEDVDKAWNIVNDPNHRLNFLKEFVSDKDFRQKPKSFFPEKKLNTQTTPAGESDVQRLKRLVMGTAMQGPNSDGLRLRASDNTDTRPKHKMFASM